MTIKRPDTTRLEAAIQQVVTVQGSVPSNFYLSRWMVIGVAEDPEDPARHCYFRIPQGGYMAPHESLGLLHVVGDMIIDAVTEGEDYDDD